MVISSLRAGGMREAFARMLSRASPLRAPNVTRMAVALVGLPTLSDAEPERISRLNPGWAIERDDDGALLVSPTFTEGGQRSLRAGLQLLAYAARVGGSAFDSSTGFTMTTGAVRSPDAAWIDGARIAALSADDRRGFWKIAPDVVIEIASISDAWSDVVAKIEMYARHGTRYAIAIDPERRTTFALGSAPDGLVLDIDAIIGPATST